MADRVLLEHVSEYMREFREMKAIMESLQPEIEGMGASAQQILEDVYIDTASIEAIQRYEKILGITVVPGASEEERRRSVKAILYDTGGYTLKAVSRYLDGILGAGCYTISVEGYVFQIGLALSVKNRYVDVEKYLKRTLPANMVLSVDYLYNTYGALREYTHADLHSRTHQQIREEELA